MEKELVILEDESKNVKIYVEFLGLDDDIEIVHVRSITELEALIDSNPERVRAFLLDIHLGHDRLNEGIEAAKILNEKAPGSPVIAVSSNQHDPEILAEYGSIYFRKSQKTMSMWRKAKEIYQNYFNQMGWEKSHEFIGIVNDISDDESVEVTVLTSKNKLWNRTFPSKPFEIFAGEGCNYPIKIEYWEREGEILTRFLNGSEEIDYALFRNDKQDTELDKSGIFNFI